MTYRKRIFISYKTVQPDSSIAGGFHHALTALGAKPFLAEKDILLGEEWGDRVAKEIEECDYFLVLLSENSINSDMVTEEVRRAKARRDKSTDNKPVILPVRLNLPFDAKINYDLSGYLNRTQQRMWKSTADTRLIAGEIMRIGCGAATDAIQLQLNDYPERTKVAREEFMPSPNAPLENPVGMVTINSPFYIVRKGEVEFTRQILRPGSLLKIKGPRQFGKTSLLSRINDFAAQNNHCVVAMSLQQFDATTLNNLNMLLLQIAMLVTRKLGLPDKTKQFWDDSFLTSKLLITTYFEDYIFQKIDKPIVFAIDEADRLFEFTKVSADFFGLLRSWNEEAKNNPTWARLKLIISHATDANLAIQSINQSPFNVGIENFLSEFTFEQVSELAIRHSLNMTVHQISELMDMIGGHPFLVRTALYELARGNYSFDELIEKAPRENGPFADHLRRHLLNLNSSELCLNTLKRILLNQPSYDIRVCDRLKAAGLITGISNDAAISNKIYDIFFSKMLL
ncbi:MAG: AAA-like domain-containing protein [Paludibacteraceae bacterium]|nr:AAA-like domain-containing protein [Paludibacteraceae bacterium]